MDMEKVPYKDVLADRYATASIVNLWGYKARICLERELWLSVLRAQKELGLQIPEEAIPAYECQIYNVDLESIKKRELETRQDVVARVAEFNHLAGFELVGIGLTSRDTTDNIEQLQIKRSLEHARNRTVAVLGRFARKAVEFGGLPICGRSHNVPGQIISFGKRFSNFAEELLFAFERLEHLINTYPLRGIKGAMGTQQDMVDLLGSSEKALQLENLVREYLGFGKVFDSVGQVYPRSLDYAVLSSLTQLASAFGNFAKMIRLMAGNELLHEGFKKGQTGSFAQPHKMNSRTSERISGLLIVLSGYEHMAKGLCGDQWYEGDVSCSVVRRVALPGGFFAYDGMCESVLTVLDEMEIFPKMIDQELKRFLPFLSTTRLLMAICKKGYGRDTAHEIIKKHAVLAIKEMRQGKENSFLGRLMADGNFPLASVEIESLVKNPEHGASLEQIAKICVRVVAVIERYPEAVKYNPQPIL